MILSFLGEVHFLDKHRQQSVRVNALLGLLGPVGLGGLLVGFVGGLGREIECRFFRRLNMFDRRKCGPQQRLAAACSNHLV